MIAQSKMPLHSAQDAIKHSSIWQRNYRQKYPWLKHLQYAKDRCKRAKSYVQRGITVNLNPPQIRLIWERDKAMAMLKPSIDRIDGNKGYTFENCRFITRIGNFSIRKCRIYGPRTVFYYADGAKKIVQLHELMNASVGGRAVFPQLLPTIHEDGRLTIDT